MMVEDFGFNLDDLRRFMLNGILGAFIPEEDKPGLAATFATEFDTLRRDCDWRR
jgi:adenosine deaminase